MDILKLHSNILIQRYELKRKVLINNALKIVSLSIEAIANDDTSAMNKFSTELARLNAQVNLLDELIGELSEEM